MATKNNNANVKLMNKELIKAVLKATSVTTKADIASTTGLSQGTCNTILNELVAAGEVLAMEQEICNGGRPAKQYRYNGDFSEIICLNVENDCSIPVINYAVVNLLGEVKEMHSVRKEKVDYNTLEELIGQLLKLHPNTKGVGLGIPGVVVDQKKILTCDVQGLTGCPLAEKLQTKYGISVILENDMNLTALGFYKAKNYPLDATIAVLTYIKENFPGSGMIVNGQIHRGNTYFAGEIAYLPYDCTRKEQFALLKTREGVIALTVKSLCSIIAVLNPQTILLTGSQLSGNMMEEIKSRCQNIIPLEHMPQVLFVEETQMYYLRGLIDMTLDEISSPMDVFNYSMNMLKHKRDS